MLGVPVGVDPGADLFGVEADQAADLDVGDAPFGNEPAEVTGAAAELFGELEAVQAATAAWEADGMGVTVLRRADTFARMTVRHPSGDEVRVDLAADARHHEPATMSLGPVISKAEAVGSKVAARSAGARPATTWMSPASWPAAATALPTCCASALTPKAVGLEGVAAGECEAVTLECAEPDGRHPRCLRGPSRLPAGRRDGPLRVTTGRSTLLTGHVLTCHTHLHPHRHAIFVVTVIHRYCPLLTAHHFAP